MKYLKISLLSLVILSLVYCATSRVTPYPNVNYSPTELNHVQIYHMPPPIPFEIIGEVNGRGGAFTSWSTVRHIMKKAASSIGGDAVIIIDKKTSYVGTYQTPSTGNAFVYGNYLYYTYKPGTSYAIRKKFILGVVVKWK